MAKGRTFTAMAVVDALGDVHVGGTLAIDHCNADETDPDILSDEYDHDHAGN